MQLSEFLKNGGTDRVNIIAISWTEDRYGEPSESRLNRMVNSFHPAIKVIHANDAVVKDFSPLVYVPANFIFAPDGRLVHGDGSRNPLEVPELEQILANIEKNT